MKFQQSGAIPEAQLSNEIRIGNVYRSKGKVPTGAAYWVAVGENPDKALTMLAGISREMFVISVAAYPNEKVEGMERIGYCNDVAQFTGKIAWGV
jgi:hypothetical protein